MLKNKITSQQFLTVSALLVGLGGMLCLGYLLSLPSDPKNAVWLGYSANRLLLAGIIVAGLVGALLVAVISWRKAELAERLESIAKKNQRLTNYFGVLVSVGLVLAALAVSVRQYIPEIYSTSYQRILPLLLFVMLALLHGAALIFSQLQTKLRWRLILGAMFVFLTGFYFGSTVFHAVQINTDARRSDQVAWVEFTEKVREAGFRDSGSRNFMPAYAYLQALFIDLEQTTEEQFLSGKLVNIGLSVLLLAGLGYFLCKQFKLLAAYVLLVLVGFNLFIFKAAYFQPELLFYFVYFLIFYLTLRMLQKPNWKLAVLTGLALAAGHYIKASVLPGLLAFAVPFVLKQIMDWWNAREDQKASRRLMASLLNLTIVVLTFLAVLSPYLLESKAKYGTYFYNVNTTFYVWNDNWTQALNTTRLHGDQVGWPDMPVEDLPSLQKYVREHTWEDVFNREVNGLGDAVMSLLRPYGMISYQAIYSVLAVVLLIVNRSRVAKILRKYWAILLYSAFLFPGYYALFAWYAPLSGSTARFVSGLLIPFMFALFILLDKIADKDTQLQIGTVQFSTLQLVDGTHWFVLILLVAEIFFAIPQRLMELVF